MTATSAFHRSPASAVRAIPSSAPRPESWSVAVPRPERPAKTAWPARRKILPIWSAAVASPRKVIPQEAVQEVSFGYREVFNPWGNVYGPRVLGGPCPVNHTFPVFSKPTRPLERAHTHRKSVCCSNGASAFCCEFCVLDRHGTSCNGPKKGLL